MKIVLSVSISILFISGCAAFKNNQLKEKKVNILTSKTIYLKIHFKGEENGKIAENYSLGQETNIEIMKYCHNYELDSFQTIDSSQRLGAKMACTIYSEMKSKMDRVVLANSDNSKDVNSLFVNVTVGQKISENKILGTISFLSLCVFPFKTEIAQSWDSDVFINGKLIKKYVHSDGVTIWHSILLLPATPFVVGYNKSITNLNRVFTENLAYDLQRDNLL